MNHGWYLGDLVDTPAGRRGILISVSSAVGVVMFADGSAETVELEWLRWSGHSLERAPRTRRGWTKLARRVLRP